MQFEINGKQYTVDEYPEGFMFTEWDRGSVAHEGNYWDTQLEAQQEAIEYAARPEPEPVDYSEPHWSTQSWR